MAPDVCFVPCHRGSISAPGIFLDPFPTHDHFRLPLTPYPHQAIRKLSGPLIWTHNPRISVAP